MNLAPNLDPQSDEPIYRQLFVYLRDEILSGRIASGDKIPPTRDLAGQLGLNRTTVSAAYELLEQEGLLRGHVGRGSFVQGPQASDEPEHGWEGMLPGRPALDYPAAAPATPEMIRFDSARPSEELFPLDEFRETVRETIDGGDAGAILQLGSPYGYGPLRDYLLDKEQVRAGGDLLITNGCQQAVDLIQRALTAPGDTVLVEDPVYPGLKNIFLGAGMRMLGVPVQPNGLDVEALERLVARERPRLMVLTPNFQNPTGISMTRAAREAVLRIGRTSRTLIVENDIYGDLRYTGTKLPTLKEMDESGSVLQIKSFSKIAFPGLRVGWVMGPRPAMERLAETKQWTDLHTGQLAQAVLLRFAASGRLARHQRLMCEAGSERLRAVLHALDSEMPAGVRYTRPEGGMNLWLRLPEPLDAEQLLMRAQRENVTFLAGRWFAVTRVERGSLRLSFAGLEPARIRTGIERLARLIVEERDRAGAPRRADPAPAIV